MEIKEFLREVTALPGLPGFEGPVGQYIVEVFEPLTDDQSVDVMGNVIARLGSEGPRVMISAHQDEIGLMVTGIEKDGSLRVSRNGGVDPRILPSMEVKVLAKSGALYGVVGATPPHLQAASDPKKAVELKDVFIDLGYSPQTVREKVRIGDPIVMISPLVELANDRVAGKTMDDRAGVAIMLECAKNMRRLKAPAQTFFVSSTQEEVGVRGAKTSAYAIDPDFAIAIDVTHGTGPGTGPFEAFALDKVVLVTGPNLHPLLNKKLKETAKRHRIETAVEVASGPTGTDARALQIACAGVPCVLISVPLKYMHTTVETLSLDMLREAGRLLAHFIDDVAREWGEFEWY